MENVVLGIDPTYQTQGSLFSDDTINFDSSHTSGFFNNTNKAFLKKKN